MAKVYKPTISRYGASLELRRIREAAAKSTIKRDVQNNGSALGYLGGRLAIGTAGLFEGFGDFVAGSIYQLAGDREYAKYLHDNDVTGGWQKKLDEEYNPSRGMQIAGDIASGVGQALPSVAVGIATGGTSTAVQVAGTVALGTAYAGRGVTAAVQKTGELGAKENIYGILSGAAEGATEMFLGGTQKAGKALWTAGRSSVKKGAATVARNGLMKGIWSSASSEFAEEFLQEYIDMGLLRLTGVDKEASTSIGDALYSGLIGGLTGGLLGGVTGSINTANNLRRGESIRARGLEGQLLSTANYVRNDYIGKNADFRKIDSPALRTLSAAVDAYNKLGANEKVSGMRGAVLLGEIQAGVFAFETATGIRARTNAIMANPTQEMAVYASTAEGKTVTVEDLRQNRGGVAEMLAVRDFAMNVMSESGTDIRAERIREKVASERFGNIQESASFAADVEADGSAVYRMKDGRYVIVTADQTEGNEGKYRLGFSETAEFDAERVMQQGGIDGEKISRTLAGLADDSLTYNNETQRVEERAKAQENAPESNEGVVDGQLGVESANEAQRENASTRKAIAVTEDGKVFVKASRNVISGDDPKVWKNQIFDFFDSLLSEGDSLDIPTLEGDTLTITWDQTAYKAREDQKMVGGAKVPMSDSEFRVKLNASAHIDELVEIASGKNKDHKGDSKNHDFAKDGFIYRTAYFQDFDGSYYKLTISIGKNGQTGTVYNIGKIEKDVTPSAKIIAVAGSRPLRSTSSGTIIAQNPQKSTDSAKKVSEDNGSGRKALKREDARKDPETGKYKKREEGKKLSRKQKKAAAKKAERMAAAMREGIGATENGQSGTPVPTDGEMRGRGYTDAEANAARGLVKDFDLLQPQARRAIIEMMRSGKATGASRTFMRHAANLIAYWRRDLWVMCDDKIRDDGFFYVFDDGTRLITVKPKAEGRSISEALMHELGHDVWQRADAKTRKALYDMAVDGASKSEIDAIRERYRKELKKRGDLEGLSKEQVSDLLREEIAVNRLGEMLGKEEFLDRLAGGEISVGKRFLRTLSVMKKRFTGKDKYLYRKADDLFRGFTRVMAGQSVTGVNGEKMHVSGGRHLLAIDNQGNKVVVMYEDVLKGATGSPHQIVANQIAAHIGEYYTIFESGQKVFIGEDLPGEYTQSKYTQNLLKRDLKTLKVKNKASQNFGEMIEIATNRRWEKAKHTTNKDAKYGFYRYTTKIAVPIFDNSGAVVNANIYKADLLIRNASDGRKYLYDITEIKKERSSSLPQSWITKIGKIVSTSTTNSISQNSKKSTTSVKKVSENNGSGRKALPKVDGEDMIARDYERGMGQKSQTPGKTTPKRKRKTNAEVKAEERARADKLVSAEKDRIERDAAQGVNKASRTTARLNQQIQYLKNAVSHRKHTDGGNDAAHVLENSALKGFIKYFANRTAAYGVAHQSTREAVRGLLPWYTAENEALSGNVLDELLAKSDKNTGAVFGYYNAEVRARMEQIANGEGNLSAAELESLGSIVGAVAKLYESYGRVWADGKWQDAEALAKELYADLLSARKALVSDTDENGKGRGALKRLRNFLKTNYLYSAVTPEAVLRDLEGNTKSGVLSRLYRQIRLGEAESKQVQANILQPVAEFFAEKENRKYHREISSVKRFEYRGVELTTAQAVGLYETSKRAHAQGRLFDLEKGGFRVAVFDEATGTTVTRELKTTKEDIDSLYNQFTEQDLAFIAALEESFKRSTEHKVKTDKRVLGYTNAVGGHYYPITTDENYFAKDVTDIRDKMGYAQVVYNKSFNKNTVEGAQAWLFVEDALTVLNRHASGIGAYAGLYSPLQTFGIVYGKKFDPTGQAGKEGAADAIFFESVAGKTSLREYLNSTLWNKRGNGGTGLDDYLTKLFSDIQGIREVQTGVDRLVAKLQGAAVTASFGLNLKVIATQLASYPAAYKNLDADVLAKALAMKPDMEAMDEHSRITFARSFDGIGAAEGGLEQISEIGRMATKGIDFTDRQVIGRLWNACQLQVEKDGGGSFGSEENLKAAGDMLDNLLLDTQTTSLKADASALGRDKNVLAKMLTMFKTESMKSFSNLYGSFSAYVDHRRYADAGMDGYAEMLEDDKKTIGKNVTAFLLSNAWVAAVAVAFSRIRKAARGEEEEEQIALQFAKEMGGNVADLFPIVSEVTSYLTDGYDMDYMPLATINDTLSMLAGVGVLADAESTAAEKNKYIRQSVITLGEIVGLPTKNAGRIALTLTSNVSKSSAYALRDRYDTSPTYQSDLDRALAIGNERLASTVISAWFERKKGGKTSDAVTDEILRLYALTDGEGKSILSMPKNVPSSLSAKQAAAFSAVYSEADGAAVALLGSSAYQALDDNGRAKAIKACYDMAWSRAAMAVGLEDVGSAAKMASASVDPVIMSAVAGYAKAYVGEKRKESVIAYLRSLGISDGEMAAYLAALGYKVSEK